MPYLMVPRTPGVVVRSYRVPFWSGYDSFFLRFRLGHGQLDAALFPSMVDLRSSMLFLVGDYSSDVDSLSDVRTSPDCHVAIGMYCGDCIRSCRLGIQFTLADRSEQDSLSDLELKGSSLGVLPAEVLVDEELAIVPDGL